MKFRKASAVLLAVWSAMPTTFGLAAPAVAAGDQASPATPDARPALLADAERQLAEYRRVLAALKDERERLRQVPVPVATAGYGVAGAISLVVLGCGLGAVGGVIAGRWVARRRESLPAIDSDVMPTSATWEEPQAPPDDSGPPVSPAAAATGTLDTADPDLPPRLRAAGAGLAGLSATLAQTRSAFGEAVSAWVSGTDGVAVKFPGFAAEGERLAGIATLLQAVSPAAEQGAAGGEDRSAELQTEVDRKLAAALEAIPLLCTVLVGLGAAATVALRDAAEWCRTAAAAQEAASAGAGTSAAPAPAAAAAPDPQTDAVFGLVIDGLRFAGYLDWEGGRAGPAPDHPVLAGLLVQAAADARARPELQAYVHALGGLREALGEPAAKALPWVRIAGLGELHRYLCEKRSFQALYCSETPREALLGQWGSFLQPLFRACLLLESYWPDADPGFAGRLRRCRDCAVLALGRYGIAPHPLALPVARTWLQGRSWVEEGPGVATAPDLAKDPVVPARIATLGAPEVVFYDVAWWGYTLTDDQSDETGSASLLVRW